MTGINAFNKNVERYEQWFIDNPFAYISELHAVRALLPDNGSGIEIGIGTGRFAGPLGISRGVEPSRSMAELARKKGLEVFNGVAEQLPFRDEEFDFALMVTTVCFLDDMSMAFQEVRRILKPEGSFVIGFMDRSSPLGREYQARKNESAFYKDARFYSIVEIVPALEQAGFDRFSFRQTIFHPLSELTAVEPIEEGHGRGSFVVVRATRK